MATMDYIKSVMGVVTSHAKARSVDILTNCKNRFKICVIEKGSSIDKIQAIESFNTLKESLACIRYEIGDDGSDEIIFKGYTDAFEFYVVDTKDKMLYKHNKQTDTLELILR